MDDLDCDTSTVDFHDNIMLSLVSSEGYHMNLVNPPLQLASKSAVGFKSDQSAAVAVSSRRLPVLAVGK